uniref:3-oxoacyl-[acyl-carrier protein] reductase n=1 Tax=uncultured Armatimonadetes bacterium TaxID=157466 RepID=A0A6J4IUG4_9BACT|nr:3-oxoacyl-[acyl-carrier protein] reductase [uncultured Armatimonadetes bacterium]
MGDRMSGKVAVITGSTGGLGEGIARRLAAEGARVVVSGRRAEEGEAVARGIAEAGGEAFFRRADVAREEDCVGLIEAAHERFGRLDVLVNNAAALAHHPFEELSTEQWDAAYAANVRGPMLLSRASIPHMRAGGGGSIINIGTTMAYRGGNLERIAYSSSKGALLTLTKVMAGALVKDHIRVNWVIVGWIATPQEVALRDRTHGDGDAFLKEMSEKRPMGRLETPDDIAAGVLYLASDESSHVTGGELNISGGLMI